MASNKEDIGAFVAHIILGNAAPEPLPEGKGTKRQKHQMNRLCFSTRSRRQSVKRAHRGAANADVFGLRLSLS